MPRLNAVCSKCGEKIYCKAYSHHWKRYGLFPGVKDNCKHEAKKGTIT